MRRPAVKKAHDPVRFSGGRIRIGSVQYGVGAEIIDESGYLWAALGLMDGTRSPDEVVDALVEQNLDPESAVQIVQDLCSSGHVEDLAADPDPRLSQRQLERYSRNDSFFTWVDTEPRDTKFQLQANLSQARVAVLGLGGSGSHVAASLAAAGVGLLRCVDFDDVELSNLSRQLLYIEDDVGHAKTQRLGGRLSRMNSQVRIEPVEKQIDSVSSARQAIGDVDFVVLCADVPHPDIQLWTNDAAHQLGLPWSVCFYAGPTLMTGIFLPGRTPCYRCLQASGPTPLRADDGEQGQALYNAQNINAVIAPTAGLAGQFGALEAIYFLAGLRPQTVGRLFHQNLMVYDHNYYVEPVAQADCDQCRHLAGSERANGG